MQPSISGGNGRGLPVAATVSALSVMHALPVCTTATSSVAMRTQSRCLRQSHWRSSPPEWERRRSHDASSFRRIGPREVTRHQEADARCYLSVRNRPVLIGRGDKIRTCDPLHPMQKSPDALCHGLHPKKSLKTLYFKPQTRLKWLPNDVKRSMVFHIDWPKMAHSV
jgi:hypothetical protein